MKLFSITLALLLVCSQLFPQGDLLITPRRIVFDANDRSKDINLANTGQDSATYQISFTQVRMKTDGSFENIVTPDSGQLFADKNLRIFPRTVTLAPNETQVVKLQLVKKADLPDGEYRSHIYFRAIPNDKPLGSETKSNDSTLSVRLIPVFGISIPAIIRKGETNAAVEISDASVYVEQDTSVFLKATLNRTGNRSVYGDLAVDHTSSYGKTVRVAEIHGVAVYTPNPTRVVKILLKHDAGADLSSGKLMLTYTEQSPKNMVLAHQELGLDKQ
jgi:hypothetical protein